ncbi:MAG: tellurite resistance TerB family protein [Myxococcota bacterium]
MTDTDEVDLSWKALPLEGGASALDALVDTMALAAHADGEVSPEERAEMLRRFMELTRREDGTNASGVGVTATVPTERFDTTLRRVAEGDRAGVLAEVKSRLASREARKAALGLAVAVMTADGIVRTDEREVILELAEAFDLTGDEAADLVAAVTRATTPSA